jgi:sec-independent protein translocase protein TatA
MQILSIRLFGFLEFIGTTELLVVLFVALIVFGPRKLPELGRSLGQALRQVRAASDDFKRTWEVEALRGGGGRGRRELADAVRGAEGRRVEAADAAALSEGQEADGGLAGPAVEAVPAEANG